MPNAPRSIAEINNRLARLRTESDSVIILDEAEGMARVFAEMDGWQPDPGERLRDGESERARQCWYRTCAAFSYLRGIELEKLIETDSPSPPQP